MKSEIIVQRLLKAAAYIGVLLSAFPFAVLFEGLGVGDWHAVGFAAVFGAWAAFGGFGLLAAFLVRRAREKKKRGKALLKFFNFLLNIGFLVPAAALIAVCAACGVNSTVYLYVLPAAVVMYFGGNKSAGKSYSDVFTKGWFLFYLISALFALILFAVSKNEDVKSVGNTLLCAGFGVIVLLSAVLSNQTNIDSCTKQRGSRGKVILPYGMRRYNALLVFGVFALALGLFAFAKPIGAALGALFTLISKGFARLLVRINGFTPDGGSVGEGAEPEPDPEWGDAFAEPAHSAAGQVLTVVFLVGLLFLAFRFRKTIWSGIKYFFAPFFKCRRIDDDVPFSDEIMTSGRKELSERARRKAERDLSKQYRRETDPERKYRLGYALFLSALRRTERPPVPSDTSRDHREKGEAVFGADLGEFTEVYARVRYAGGAPTADELSRQEETLARLPRDS